MKKEENKKPLSPSKVQKKKLVASRVNLWTNIVLPPLKLTVGILGKSSALIADAVNSIADVISYAVMYIFLKISGKPKDEDHHYGHGKYEIIATFALSMMMIGAATLIMAQAVQTFYAYFKRGVLPEVPSISVVAVALFTMLLKTILYFYTKRQAVETKSEGLMAQALDHKSDVFTALAVVIGVGGAIIFEGIGQLLEPLAAFIVAIAIIRMGISILKPSFLQLTDGSLPFEDEEKVKALVLSVPGVYSPHNIKSRMIGSSRASFELDLCVKGSTTVLEAHDRVDLVEKAIRNEYGSDTHIIVHIEPLEIPCYDVS